MSEWVSEWVGCEWGYVIIPRHVTSRHGLSLCHSLPMPLTASAYATHCLSLSTHCLSLCHSLPQPMPLTAYATHCLCHSRPQPKPLTLQSTGAWVGWFLRPARTSAHAPLPPSFSLASR